MKRAALTLELSHILLQERPLKERLQAFLETLLSHPWLSLEPRGAIFLRRGERLVLVAEHRLDEPPPASLNTLVRYPFSLVKVDRGFVRNIGSLGRRRPSGGFAVGRGAGAFRGGRGGGAGDPAGLASPGGLPPGPGVPSGPPGSP